MTKRINRGQLYLMTWMLCVSCAAGCGVQEGPEIPDEPFVWPDMGLGGGADGVPFTGSCSSSTCSGCCLGDVCMSGLAASACGAGGMSCTVCQGQQLCTGGFCVAAKTCDATSCPSGCCGADNTCQQGDSASACGTGGGACTACASGDLCTNNSCAAKDPGLKTYTVIAEKANVTNAGVLFCNSNMADTLCDVYLNVKGGSESANTKTINNSMHPQWNKTLFKLKGTELKAGITVKAYDDDPGPFNPRMCSVSYTVTDADLTGGQASIDCSAAGVKMVTIFLKLTPS
jgi:C2 domain